MIGEDVVIEVVSVRGDRVRVGIEAPREIEVHRREVWLKIHREREDKQDHLAACIPEQTQE